MNSNLKAERAKINFNIDEFTNFFYGGSENVAKKRFLENYLLSDERLNLSLDTSYLSYKEKYEEAMRRSVVIYEKLRKLHGDLGKGENDFLDILDNLRVVTQAVNKDGNPITLHYGMFAFGLQFLSSDEQKAEWLPRLLNFEIFGTYAQTELGHGTFVRGLETTATYDPKNKEFVLHSPTVTARKWWPGHLGKSSNYAVVMAQLISLGENHGVQPFIVQLRDENTHESLLGISVGDIGNRIGFDTVNNGYLSFNNVRIPLKNMLMRNARINDDGSFERINNPLLNYGVMLYTRVSILLDASLVLSKAATIAVRYSLVRKQSVINHNEDEPQIMDYATQQQKVIPAMVKAIVFKIIANRLLELRIKMNEELRQENLNNLPEIHALSCGLKAVCTNETVKAIETCRLSCGGHGFLDSAGFYTLYKLAVTYQTYEGDNTVLLLQTARFLMKAFDRATNKKIVVRSVSYIREFLDDGENRATFDDSLEGILRAVQAAAAGKIASAWKKIESKKKSNSIEEATNQAGIELIRAAELHCQVFILQTAIEELRNAAQNSSPALGEVFKNVLELYAVDLVLNLLGDIMRFVDVTSSDIEKLQKRLENSLKFFRTSALGIVDGFDFSDEVLSSTLGVYDGNVYKRLINAAKKSPLNQEDVNRTFNLYLKPLMKSSL